MTAVGQQHVGPEPVEDLFGQVEEDRHSRWSGDRSARLDTVGMRVTRTALTLRSIISAARLFPSSALNLWTGNSRAASISSRDVSRSGSRIPVVSVKVLSGRQGRVAKAAIVFGAGEPVNEPGPDRAAAPIPAAPHRLGSTKSNMATPPEIASRRGSDRTEGCWIYRMTNRGIDYPTQARGSMRP